MYRLSLAILVCACAKSPAPSLTLGSSQLLTKDVAYSVSDTDLVVVNRGAGMSTVLVGGDPNKEDHVYFIKLEVSAGGTKHTIEPSSKEPVDLAGYRFRADATGYTWGAADGAVVIERLP